MAENKLTRIKYDSYIMKVISMVESLTGAKVKDCLNNHKLTFIIEKGDMGKAIGKHGSNIKRLEGMLRKQVRVIEFDDNVEQFIRNLAYPAEIKSVDNEEGIVTIIGRDMKARGMIIGRDRQNSNFIKEVAKRYFDIKDIKVA